MIESIKCKTCLNLFDVKKTGRKNTNGSWERFYVDCEAKALTLKCYPCFRKACNDKWPEKKAYYKKYEKTVNGFLMRLYRNMKSRVTGVTKNKDHLYKGKEILDKDVFYEWAHASTHFKYLYSEWTKTGYKRVLTPSVDRVDSDKGYTLDNMEWVTFSENCRRASTPSYETRSDVI